MPRFARNDAFTLAEVLITLVIIGVIAAITVPSLMNKIQRNELRSQFNKQVKIASEAVQRLKLDYGDIVYERDKDTAQIVRERFMKYFSVICSENCDNASKYRNLNNTNDVTDTYFNNCFIAQDGVSYCFYKGTSTSGGGIIYITIDVNGPNKRPNRWGHDAFTFYVNSGSQILKPTNINVPGSNSICDSSNNKYNGRGCTAKAIADPDYFKNL